VFEADRDVGHSEQGIDAARGGDVGSDANVSRPFDPAEMLVGALVQKALEQKRRWNK